MGLIVSLLREKISGLKALYTELSESSTAFSAVLNRISSSPGLPTSNPTTSFWFRNPPFPELVDRKSEIVPGTGDGNVLDVVIIGSGVTGAAIAWGLLKGGETDLEPGDGTERAEGMQQNSMKVLMLEARSICSGATGRNGGHIKVSEYDEFSRLRGRFSIERAKEIVRFQRRHLGILKQLVEVEGFSMAELREMETVDFYTEEEMWADAKRMVKELWDTDEMKDMSEDMMVWEGQEAREKFHTSSLVLGAISYRAGALWPYRLVTSILSSLLSKYGDRFSIETNTPVESITTTTDHTVPFQLHTPRGIIKAKHIIHATNGYSASLIPGLRGKIFPVRGQMTAQRPGKSFPSSTSTSSDSGPKSWCLVHPKGGLEYMIQRPGIPDSNKPDGLGGELMIGGALVQSGGRGFDEIGVANDSELNFHVGSYLGGVLPMVFGPQHWGLDDQRGRVMDHWTGIMGFTIDVLPFVGRVDERLTGRKVSKPGQSRRSGGSGGAGDEQKGLAHPAEWISAGYNGQGMVHAWLCGVAVGLMVLGKEDVEIDARPGIPNGKVADWLPCEFLLSRERLKKASIYDLATLL